MWREDILDISVTQVGYCKSESFLRLMEVAALYLWLNYIREVLSYVRVSVKAIPPIMVAIAKLANVPTSTYSVCLTSEGSFRSPKRKIDFAANKKPIPSK